MFSGFKDVLSNVAGNISLGLTERKRAQLEKKFPYGRPEFLRRSVDEVQVTLDHTARPIIVPRETDCLPWNAGYAEAVNAGKTPKNEDQAAVQVLELFFPKQEHESKKPSSGPTTPKVEKEGESCGARNRSLKAVYFALFDGHAGSGASNASKHLLHLHVQEKLRNIAHLLISDPDENILNGDVTAAGAASAAAAARDVGGGRIPASAFPERHVSKDDLVIGALETAFLAMDQQIARERHKYRISGGCAALVALFFMGKLYVANAGDCRAVICGKDEVKQLSYDFTPESERERLQLMAHMQPSLLQGEFTQLEFTRRIQRRDIGSMMLCRDVFMQGWFYKTITEEHIKFPVVFGEGKRARALATIGVTRGFGDHDLKVHDSDVSVKAFLTPMPQVTVHSLENVTDSDVLVMGTDGLWDVTSNKKASEIVSDCLSAFSQQNVTRYRYVSAAQELVMFARGTMQEGRNGWRMKSGVSAASGDDITVLVIPLLPYSHGDVPKCTVIPAQQPITTAKALSSIIPQTKAKQNKKPGKAEPVSATNTEKGVEAVEQISNKIIADNVKIDEKPATENAEVITNDVTKSAEKVRSIQHDANEVVKQKSEHVSSADNSNEDKIS